MCKEVVELKTSTRGCEFVLVRNPELLNLMQITNLDENTILTS